MKKRILIFDTVVSGHHIEYIHHLLTKANSSNDEYIFYLPEEFEQYKGNNMNWNYNKNVSFIFFNASKNLNDSSILVASFKMCILLGKAVKEFNVTHVFLISLIAFIPFLPLFVSRKIKVSGIIYQIYLYRWKNSSFIQKALDVFKYLILSYSKCINNIYILNDEASARRFNEIYNSNKYTFIVDPYVPINAKEVDVNFLNIIPKNKIYFHFGSLSERKGTLEILKAIKLVKPSIQKESTFIFAGKVKKEISEDFYRLISEIKQTNSSQIIIIDRFCEYSLIAELCKKSDILLMPYKVVSQSSGVIGYAAQYNTPVLAPAKGLIGKLVKKYKLGYVIPEVNSYSIAEFINKRDILVKQIPSNYLKENNVDNFINTINF